MTTLVAFLLVISITVIKRLPTFVPTVFMMAYLVATFIHYQQTHTP